MHRDIKPENVLIDAAGNAVLTDFGYTKTFAEATYVSIDGEVRTQLGPTVKSSAMCGTMGYAAPEVLNEEPYAERCDLYSLGCMLHEMVFGFVSLDRAILDSIKGSNQCTTQRPDEECPYAIARTTLYEQQPTAASLLVQVNYFFRLVIGATF